MSARCSLRKTGRARRQPRPVDLDQQQGCGKSESRNPFPISHSHDDYDLYDWLWDTDFKGKVKTPLTKLQDFTDKCLRLGSDLSTVPKTLYNQEVLDKVAVFHSLYRQSLLKRPTKIAYYYSSFGEQIHPKVTARGELLKEKAGNIFTSGSCTMEFAGASKLLGWFYDVPSSTTALETIRTFHWGGFGKAYICLVSLGKFAEFITNKDKIRSYMFEANVRDYQGDVTVNQQIAATLSKVGSEEFWWLNNGITLLASHVRLDGDSMSVTDPLIVNGLQTSHTIFSHRKLLENDKRTVLVRVIEISNSASIDAIIKATNSQTTIPKIWLHATEDIHRKIETVLKSSGLYYDRRKNFHRNQGVSSSQIITIPYLSQALAAIVLQQPDDARARPTTVADRHYKKLFSDSYPKELYSKCALILRRVDELLDSLDSIDRTTRLNLIFYLGMYATCVALKSPAPKRPSIASVDLEKLSDSLLTDCLTVVQEEYVKFGADDKAAKGSNMTAALRERLQDKYGRGPSRAGHATAGKG